MNKRFTWLITAVVLSLLVLSSCGVAITPSSGETLPSPTAASIAAPVAAPAVSVSTNAPAVVTALETTLEQLYNQVNPSVVNIQVLEQVSNASPTGIPGLPSQGSQQQAALGSGFVWDKQGDIVTNNHVVANADSIKVTFQDGTVVPGQVVGTDPSSDLAVVKVDVPAAELHPVQVADSTQVKVGELAIAIGNPFGLNGSMTVGFVSALGRSLPADLELSVGASYTIPDIIQTDAPINPGNSGGVLVNDQGQLIGVTAAIESSVSSNAGIGFAIPSAIVQKVVPVLISSGHYEHTWLGISGTTLTPELAQAMGLSSDQRGALVVDVTSGGPADKAGLHGSTQQVTINGETARVGGDVIVAINGQPVQDFDSMVSYLTANTTVGQTITLTVLRNGKTETVPVTLTARPQSQAGSTTPVAAGLGILGVTVTPAIAQAMGLSSDVQGVLVEQVEPGSPADQAGLHASSKSALVDGQHLSVGGDIIIALDGIAVTGMDDLSALLQQVQSGQQVALAIVRDGRVGDVVVTLAQASAPLSLAAY